MANEAQPSGMPDVFDRLLGSLDGLPDVVRSKASTLRSVTPLLGAAQTFIVQTYRQREIGDHIFIELIHGNGSLRLAIPPKVADVIARQRDQLSTAVRRKIGKANAEDRKARGEKPAFLMKKVVNGKD